MRNLHKKIVAGSLIGIISIGIGLSQGSKVFADCPYEIEGPVEISNDEKEMSLSYLSYSSEWFGYQFEKIEVNDNLKVDKHFRNPQDFLQYLYDEGKEAGESGFYWIDGYYYHFSFDKKINAVPYSEQWEYDSKKPLIKFYDYFFERI